ncbi:alcohol dehydrogenase catalytic domain-containing protein [Novosphingobium sp. 9U]|uniref:alcohol dehydrogenase catalytic domain-containing protein n=1 Tax=Novosphingobium sp. 9U TaxID=2653158 RepID=UPI0012EF5A2B|nr:alcohol dehydrogenase catalytic domain-containing protein [Novosphingobium sp. 9U]VWX54678.1 Alcohol dehydrogenase [Novosphingobium sp. 9U]
MKAAIYAGRGGAITIEDIAEPSPGPGEVLIKVHRCGICGTDLSMTKGEMWDYGPGQFGHEYAGEIVALGSGVERLKLGGKIAVLPSGSCGHCADCAGGNPVLCNEAPGVTQGFSEFARVPEAVAVSLPDTLSMTDGALIEPLAVSLYGVRQSQMTPGDRVLVLGGGTVALYAIYWARRLAAGRIVAASRSDRRRDLCLAMGADAFVPFGDNEIGEVAEALGGPPDVVYECVGVPGMVGKALMHARKYGKVVSLGFCTQPDPIMPSLASYKCATVQFLVGYTMKDFLFIADRFDAGHIDPRTIVTNEIPLASLPDMFATLRGSNNETKVHVLT